MCRFIVSLELLVYPANNCVATVFFFFEKVHITDTNDRLNYPDTELLVCHTHWT